ncbi:MAG: cell division ATP-binding protein FtsE [Alphaproteobacteria bacterium]
MADGAALGVQTTAASADTASVRIEHIGKRYGADPPILSDISLSLDPGGFCVLTGAGGSGKTTLLKIVSLAERPSSGRLVLFGSDTGRLDWAGRAALRRRIGIVFQEVRVVEDWSVADNVALPLRLAGTAERDIGRNVPELLAWLGLEKRIGAPVSTLSGSERQLVAIARAIAGRPGLLIADEPIGNVDGRTARLLARIFQSMNRLGTTVLIATRDIAFARQFGERVLRLENGTLSAEPCPLDA